MQTELRKSIASFLPELKREAFATEENGYANPALLDRVKTAGLFRIFQPKRYGGYEYNFEVFVDLMSALGQGCGSTAWVCSVGAFHAFNVALFPEKAQEEVWGDNPLAVAGSSYVPAGTAKFESNGVVLSGTWPYVSGSDHFEWTVVGAKREDGEEGLFFCLVPKTTYDVLDDWDVTGLRGTGSKSIKLDNVFIPKHRVLSFDEARTGTTPGAAFNKSKLYRTPFFACSSYCLISPALGIAEGALANFIQEVGPREVKSLRGHNSALSAHYPVQLRVSEASALIDAAKLIIRDDCREMSQVVDSGHEMSVQQKLRNKRNQVTAIQFLKRALDLLIGATGTKGIGRHNVIQLASRDIHAISSHITLNFDIVMPTYGRHLLGQDPGVPI